jgi:uncharacterized protein (TIGR00369 family)
LRRFDEAALRRIESRVPFNRFLGIRLDEVGAGSAAVSLPVRPEFVGDPQPPALHGGVLSALIDTAGGLAAWSALEDDGAVSTVDLRVDYLEPGRVAGELRAEARVARSGTRVCHVQIELTQDDVRIAEGRGVYRVHRPRD